MSALADSLGTTHRSIRFGGAGMISVLVNACLLGERVRYDGTAASSGAEWLRQWTEELRIVPCCPEVEAGLPIPGALPVRGQGR